MGYSGKVEMNEHRGDCGVEGSRKRYCHAACDGP